MTEEKLDIMKTALGGEYRTRLNRFYKQRRKWEPADPKVILSFMPGSVVEYRVSVGDRVRRGDVLLLFRAMKMNNVIAAPADGVIRALGAQVGANVPKNAPLIEFE
ncbi:MAG: acetyl-CoA carboxylase biotin carboxyl carrier protein subunit [Rikenellaceae bacterium]|jgi:biotin carboxyl carrier protein|nr:acetyl-CoA carboxylase biotin carboxyl carrier protein subunit [Rikenellaceae bacterium]